MSRRLALLRDRVELVVVAQRADRAPDTVPDPVGGVGVPRSAEPAPAQPGVEGPHCAAVVALDEERRVRGGQRPDAVRREQVRLGQAIGGDPARVRGQCVGPEQPAELRPRAVDRRAVRLQSHHVREERRLDPGPQPARQARPPVCGVRVEPDERVQRGDRDRLRVCIGERRRRHRAVRAHDPAAVLVGGRVEGVAPALLAESAGEGPRAAPHQPAACLECPGQPRSRGSGRGCQLAPQRLVPCGVEEHQEPRRRVRGAEVAQGSVADRPAELHQPVGRDRPVLVQDPAGLFLGLRVLHGSLTRGQRPERGRSDVWVPPQHLQGDDQGVPSEQGVVAARVGGLDWFGRGVGPAGW